MIDGRRASGCVRADVHRGTLPNFLPPETCAHFVAVFSRNHAAALITDAPWTPSTRDKIRIRLDRPLAVPLHVWVLYDAGSAPQRHLQMANRLYPGIEFTSTGVVDLSAGDAARAAWDLGCTEEGRSVRMALGHVANALNVYYVRETGPRGLWCEPDTILVNHDAYETTLAHEIGHALSLEHTEDTDLSDDNLMNGSGAMNQLTLGQLFRINFDARSIVNRFALRTGPTFDCGSDPACPSVVLMK